MKWLLHSCTCKNFEILGYTWISEWLRRCAASKMFVTFDFEIFHLNPDCSAIAALQNAPPPPWSFTTSLEFWPKVATRIFDGAAIRPASILTEQFEGGRFFWGRMAMYLNEMTSRMNNWFGVIRTSKFWMINFLKFATLIPWSLPRIVFFFLKKIWKIDLGFPYLGLCATACVQVFRVHCNTKSFAVLFGWNFVFDKLLWKERGNRGSVTDLQETPNSFPARFSGNPWIFGVWQCLTCSMRFGWTFQLWIWWKFWSA